MRRLLAAPTAAADYPKPQESDWVARDLRFGRRSSSTP